MAEQRGTEIADRQRRIHIVQGISKGRGQRQVEPLRGGDPSEHACGSGLAGAAAQPAVLDRSAARDLSAASRISSSSLAEGPASAHANIEGQNAGPLKVIARHNGCVRKSCGIGVEGAQTRLDDTGARQVLRERGTIARTKSVLASGIRKKEGRNSNGDEDWN